MTTIFLKKLAGTLFPAKTADIQLLYHCGMPENYSSVWHDTFRQDILPVIEAHGWGVHIDEAEDSE